VEDSLSKQVNAALLGFSGEAFLYCQGISDGVAHNYAKEYAAMLEERLKGIEAPLPRIPAGLFEPNRNLIRSTLDRMYKKHYPESADATQRRT
jgi:hypothetical protein